jgi:hypothetical protein
VELEMLGNKNIQLSKLPLKGEKMNRA